MAEEKVNNAETILKSLRAATSVALHNRQSIEILDAKVDTVGVTTVSNIKTAQEIKDQLGTVNTQLDNAMETQLSLVDSIQTTSNRVESLETSYTNTTSELADIKDNLESLDTKIGSSVEDLKLDIENVSETYLTHVNSFNERTDNMAELVKGLDYKAELTELTSKVQTLSSSIVELTNHNTEQYNFASEKLNLLEMAVASIMQSATEYRETLDALSERVKAFDSKMDDVEDAVYQLRIKPTMAAQDQILETFKSWGATSEMIQETDEQNTEPDAEETTVEIVSNTSATLETVASEPVSEDASESVFEHITLPEPEEPVVAQPKQKRGFFSKLLG